LDERFAHALAREAIAAAEFDLANAERLAREKAERGITVRELAHEWMRWLREVKQVKPATLVEYNALLREPGVKDARRSRVTHGRMMAALGDRPINRVTTREISDFLRSLARQGLTARNVNKHRQVLATMVRYAGRIDTCNLPSNPVEPTDKRPESPPAALEYFEVEEAEALARAGRRPPPHARARRARHPRGPPGRQALPRPLLHGPAVGEAVVLRWDDIDLNARTILVRRDSPPRPRRSRRAAATASFRSRIRPSRRLRGWLTAASSSRPRTTSSATSGAAASTSPRSAAATSARAPPPAYARSSSTASATPRAASSPAPPIRSSSGTCLATPISRQTVRGIHVHVHFRETGPDPGGRTKARPPAAIRCLKRYLAVSVLDDRQCDVSGAGLT
jgi:integrase